MLTAAIPSFVARMWPQRSRVWRPVGQSLHARYCANAAGQILPRPILFFHEGPPDTDATGTRSYGGEDDLGSGIAAVTSSKGEALVHGDHSHRWHASVLRQHDTASGDVPQRGLPILAGRPPSVSRSRRLPCRLPPRRCAGTPKTTRLAPAAGAPPQSACRRGTWCRRGRAWRTR